MRTITIALLAGLALMTAGAPASAQRGPRPFPERFQRAPAPHERLTPEQRDALREAMRERFGDVRERSEELRERRGEGGPDAGRRDELRERLRERIGDVRARRHAVHERMRERMRQRFDEERGPEPEPRRVRPHGMRSRAGGGSERGCACGEQARGPRRSF